MWQWLNSATTDHASLREGVSDVVLGAAILSQLFESDGSFIQALRTLLPYGLLKPEHVLHTQKFRCSVSIQQSKFELAFGEWW